MAIHGNTQIFSLIGNNIPHSLSPLIHNFLFKHFKINAVYIPMEVKNNLSNFFNFFKTTSNFSGCNITIPYKEEAYFMVDVIAETAENVKSVNCIKKTCNNRLEAYNTDIYGFIKSLTEDLKFNATNKKIVILGSGGTAKTIIHALIKNAKNITVVSRSKKNISNLLSLYSKIKWKKFENSLEDLVFPDIDLIVNTTPLGLKGEIININYNSIKPSCSFFDVLYVKSPFITSAAKRDFNASNGLNMLIYQAVKSFEIWTNYQIGDKLMTQLKKEVFNEQKV